MSHKPLKGGKRAGDVKHLCLRNFSIHSLAGHIYSTAKPPRQRGFLHMLTVYKLKVAELLDAKVVLHVKGIVFSPKCLATSKRVLNLCT